MGYTYAATTTTDTLPPYVAEMHMEIRMDYGLYRGEPVWRDVYVSAARPDGDRIAEHARQLGARLDPDSLLAFARRLGWTLVTGRDEAFRDTYCRIFVLTK